MSDVFGDFDPFDEIFKSSGFGTTDGGLGSYPGTSLGAEGIPQVTVNSGLGSLLGSGTSDYPTDDFNFSPSKLPVMDFGLPTVNSAASSSSSSFPWGDLVTGGLNLVAGNVDRVQGKQDSAFWGNQLNTLAGMYKPGTPEATLMQKEMEAKDAAAGRRSQYGTRAVDLAGKLAQQRAGIMTSAGYQNMANAYTGRNAQANNGLAAAVGNNTSPQGKGNSGIFSTLGGVAGSLLGGPVGGFIGKTLGGLFS